MMRHSPSPPESYDSCGFSTAQTSNDNEGMACRC